MRDEDRTGKAPVSPGEFDDSADTRVHPAAAEDLEDTREHAAAADDLEDTFRTGPPGAIRMEPDTEETLAASDLEEAPATEVSRGVPAGVAVERAQRSRPAIEAQRRKGRESAPSSGPSKLRMPSVRPEAPPADRPERAAPVDVEQKLYDPFSVDDPPAVGVDPALFPIHQTSPRRFSPGLLLAVPLLLVLVVVGAFLATGDEEEDARLAAERRAFEKASRARIQAGLAAAEAARRAPSAEHRTSLAPRPLDRASRIRPPRKPVVRQRFTPPIQPAEPAAPSILEGAVDRKYGERPEHVAPEATGPLLVVLSQPTAMVFDGDRLLGATPLMVGVAPDTDSKRVTLRRFGFQEKTVEAERGADGNLEVSVLLEPDPRFAGYKTPRAPESERKRPGRSPDG